MNVPTLKRGSWSVSRFVPAAAAVLAALGAFPIAAQQVVNLPARDNALQVRLTDVFRVGKAEGASWELYGDRNRVEVAFDGAGNLHVFDPQNFRVVVVSPTGSLIREIGKRGDGPGELRSPAGFAVMRDGTVSIADVGQRSFLIFDRDGAYQRSVAFATGNVVALGALAADPRGGSVISSGQRMVMMQASGPAGGRMGGMTPPSGRPIVRFPLAEGSSGREIHNAWEPPRVESQPQTISSGRSTFAIGGLRQRAFEPQLFTAVLTDGSIVVSDSSAYALEVVAPDGGVRRIYQRPLRPRQVTGAMQRAEKERRLEELAAGGGPRIQLNVAGPGGAAQPAPISQSQIDQMMRQNIEQLEFYPELPVLTGLAAGWTGKIWVARRGSDVNGPGPIDVLSPTGDYLGTIAVSPQGLPRAFGPDGLVAYVETDQFDVVSVVVRRLPAQLR
jgi:hypothetical protein